MTDYTTIPNVNALYTESEQIRKAYEMILAGGPLQGFSIGTPPPDPANPMPPMIMPVSIYVPPGTPMTPELQASLLGWLETRETAILTELSEAGVMAAPPALTREKAPPTTGSDDQR
jgi:hypothetical protein